MRAFYETQSWEGRYKYTNLLHPEREGWSKRVDIAACNFLANSVRRLLNCNEELLVPLPGFCYQMYAVKVMFGDGELYWTAYLLSESLLTFGVSISLSFC